MATTYGIGQIISQLSNSFNNEGNSYLKRIEAECKSYNVKGVNSSKIYKDYYIEPTKDNFTFDPVNAYYLKIHVGRNTFFDLNLQIKLVQKSLTQSIDLTDCYQIVKTITIPRAGNGKIGSTKIILFVNPFNEGEKILVRKVGYRNIEYNVVEDENNNDSFFCYKSANSTSTNTNNRRQITKGKDLTLAHSWEQSESDQFFDIEIIFSPRIADTFNAIFLQLERTQLDDDLYTGEGNIYGLTLGDLTSEDIELYALTNLVATEGKESFSTIGVWGDPGLMMAINGEEIKIGSNRYYELNDFEITSLGIVAKDKNDSFSIDYQFRQ